MKQPFFSIVTVCYNSEATIETTICSVLAQTEADYEYIIIDGQSSDKTLEIVKKYEAKFEGRLRVISEKDKGIYDAMNKGIREAKGKLIGLINSDDWYEKTALADVKEVYTGEEDLIHGKMTMMEDENTVAVRCFNKLDYQLIKKACIIYHPTCFVPKKTYDTMGVYNIDYQISADYDFFYRLINRKATIKYIDKPIACMRVGGASGQSVRLNLRENYEIRLQNGQNFVQAMWWTSKEYMRHGALTLKKLLLRG